jgi:16S rRNA (cytosine967-C5)-methyltransferase
MASSPGEGLGAREIAAAVLERVERDRAYADVALDAALTTSTLDGRDRGLATRLVYGTLAWQGRLDWHVGALAGRDPERLDPIVRIILRLGLYQLLFLERVPAHAAVDTSVIIAKARAPKASGLVNAVLRRAAREPDGLTLPDPATDPLKHLSVALSHPRWLVERWSERFPPEELRALLAADNEAAPTVVRARHGERDRLLARLAAAGVTAEPCHFAPDAIRTATASPHALEGYARGELSPQSEASQLVALLVGAEPGMRVLDACAAPGGKTGYLAELVGPTGRIVGLDQRRRGAAAIAGVARRLGVGNVDVVVLDARRAARALRTTFDRILVDAPCSGLGTLRSHPEVRWRRTPADVARLATLQHELLMRVTPLLAPGGVLVYATCTIMPAENERVVERWLAAHPRLVIERAGAHLPAAAAGLVDENGALRTLPHRDGLDGFYAVRVRRPD